jgi:aromatic ring-opening dioxygenase catalytic subunit (LigB family)
MSLVFAGVCSHAPGITGRKDRADPIVRDAFYAAYDRMRQALEAARPDALVVIGAEHFANFFMNNMPAICVGMGDSYEGPIEDQAWLGIKHARFPGAPALSMQIIQDVMNDVDLAYAQEWKFDHGIMVPLHFLTPRADLPIIPVNINCQGPPLIPLARCYEFGRALQRACAARPERIAVIGTGGISHWPATPDSGRINEPWDRAFLEKFLANRREELIAYKDEETWREAGQGGLEIRTFIALAGAAEGHTGELWFYAPIPIFAVGCTVAVMSLQ